MAVIKMQPFCGNLKTILTFAVSWIGVMFSQLVKQPCISHIAYSASRMSPLPSMTQDLIRFEWQILIAITAKPA